MAGSMCPSHRNCLVRFGDSSLPPLFLDPILSYLEGHRVISAAKATEIRRSPTPRMLLMKSLTRQGATAFDAFFLSLVHSQQVHLAETLRPLVSPGVLATLENNGEQRPSGSNGEMEEKKEGDGGGGGGNGEYAYDGKPSFSTINLRDIGSRVDLTFYESHKGEIYSNFSSPRGYALIISNERFRTMPERRGTRVDMNALHTLFSSLGYEVQVQENLSSKDLLHSISTFASSSSHSFTSSVVLCVLTHGEHDALFGVDDELVSTHRILSCFNSINAPNLAGKPKIILLQACRGERKDRGWDDTDSGRPLEFLSCLRGEGSRMLTRRKSPAEADLIVAYATPPLHVSWRNSEKGSWFIQAFVEVVKKRAVDSDLLSILTLVNEKVANSFEATHERFKQIPEHHSRLTKKFFFFPPNN